MPDKILTKDGLDAFIHKLVKDYDLYAPVLKGADHTWSKIQDSHNVAWEFANTAKSPKEFFLPQSERLLHFTNNPDDPDGMIMHEEPGADRPKALLNIRPCDAKAFDVLDLVFCQDEQAPDVYWKSKRDAALLIGLACKSPCPTCFCSSVHCGPHHQEGLDILLVDLGPKLLVRPLTSKGEAVSADLKEAPQEAVQEAEKQKAQAEKAITSRVDMDKLQDRTVLEEYDQAIWDRVHESCINCGTCTFYCPTCHCFDIQDETQDEFGHRIRNWDTCMSWLFTHHTSGHNPRESKKDRVRQRFMHKFKYMPIKLGGAIGCVGCGRCTQKCPVNIDVREVVNSMNE